MVVVLTVCEEFQYQCSIYWTIGHSSMLIWLFRHDLVDNHVERYNERCYIALGTSQVNKSEVHALRVTAYHRDVISRLSKTVQPMFDHAV